jgi:hypothetical protein
VTVGTVTFEVRQNGNKTPVFDVNHDGGGDVLAYDPAAGTHFFSIGLPETLGFDDHPISPWSTGWSIFAGDFDGNGRSDLFFYNPTTGRAVKAISTGTDVFKYTEFAWSPGWQVTIADLNGDGRDDVFVYDPTSGRWFRCISQLDGSFKYTASGVWSPHWSIYPGDFNGDGRTDLFLYNATSDANHGRWYRMLSNADETFTAIEGDVVWRNDWTITRGDFDGDGRTDLFLYRSTGDYYRVFFRPAGTAYDGGVWSPGWTIASGDFNGDGRTDLFAYNATTGRWYVVISDARGTLSYFGGSTNWSPGWQVTVTDLNVDGLADLVLYNPADGRWFQAVTVTPGVFTFVNGSWPTGLQIIAARPQAK